MSVVEDVRKVLQDFLAPELREIKAELAGVKQELAGVKQQVETSERRGDERHRELLEAMRANEARMDRRIDSILDYTQLRERMALIEAERQSKAAS